VKKGLWGGYPILCFPKSREEVLGGCSIFILIKIGEKMSLYFIFYFSSKLVHILLKKSYFKR
jgi:hypothetical protein